MTSYHGRLADAGGLQEVGQHDRDTAAIVGDGAGGTSITALDVTKTVEFDELRE